MDEAHFKQGLIWSDYLQQLDDNLEELLIEVRQMIENKTNDYTLELVERLEKSWNIIRKRIQFSCEKDKLFEFETSLARLKGAVKAKDREKAIIEIELLTYYYDNLED